MSAATTRACPNCNTPIPSDSKFCPSCGTAVSGIFSGGGSAMEGTAMIGVEQVDTLFPILQDATLGDYDIYGELGRGGMAAVYLALGLSLNRKVAIKTMLPDLVGKTGMVDRFKREAQTAAALSHPHIIQIFSVKQTKNLVYFVMKYIEGRSLESVIIERGQLEVDLTRVILSQVGGALAFAHRKGVVHRDMKPANIMLEEDGWAIVTDFGIAKVQEAQNLTATGTAIGTPHYMSPEQFHNKAVTGASDQYSLGVVAYEMLTGKKPFDGGTYAEIITQHLFEPPPDLRTVRADIPAAVAETVMRMMAKEASARFPDLDAAVAALGTATTTQGEKARTQIIAIAKSNAEERKARMSVPQSPIPAQRRAPPAATVVEKAEPRPSPAAAGGKKAVAAEPAKKKSTAMMIVAAVLLLAIGGGGAWAYKSGMFSSKPAGPSVDQQGTKTTPVQSATSPVVDSSAIVAAAAAARDSQLAAAAPPPENKPPVADKPPAKTPKTKPADSKTAVASNKTKGEGTGTKTGGAKTDAPTTRTATEAAVPTKTVAAAEKPAPAADKPAPVADKPAPAPEKPAAPAAPTPVQVRIGSRLETATLYVNGQTQGLVGPLAFRTFTPDASGKLKLTIKADNCAASPWDTTIVVPAGSDKIPIGWRLNAC